MTSATTQEIRDEIYRLLIDKHGLDMFEVREFLGMMFCQALVADSRRGHVADPDGYLEQFVALVKSNLYEGRA